VAKVDHYLENHLPTNWECRDPDSYRRGDAASELRRLDCAALSVCACESSLKSWRAFLGVIPLQRLLVFSGFIPPVLVEIVMPVAIMKPLALSGYDRIIFVIIMSLVGSKKTSIDEVGEGRLLTQ
jgi:hypothetical protein